jgi:hypothetical protein
MREREPGSDALPGPIEDALAAVARAVPSPSFTNRVLARLRPEPVRAPATLAWRPAVVTVVLVAVVAGGWWWRSARDGTPLPNAGDVTARPPGPAAATPAAPAAVVADLERPPVPVAAGAARGRGPARAIARVSLPEDLGPGALVLPALPDPEPIAIDAITLDSLDPDPLTLTPLVIPDIDIDRQSRPPGAR